MNSVLANPAVETRAALAPSARGALAALSLSMLLSSLGISIANVGLPSLAQAFGATFQQVQWVVLAYLLAVTALVVGAGRLGDLIGRRRLLLAGILLFTASSAVCGAAPALWLLIAARAAQGLGAAAMMALTMAFVGETVPKARTGSAMGLLGTMSAVGTALGPTLGGALISGLGWRAIFLINVPLGIAALFAAYRYLPQDRPKEAQPGFDKLGTLLLAVTLTAYALAMTLGHGSFGPLNLALLLAAAFGITLFILMERKVPSPLIRLELFHRQLLKARLAASALVMTVMMTTLIVGPFYLARGLDLHAVAVGLAMSVGPIVTALAGIPAGRIIDRFGGTRMSSVGLLGVLLGCLLLALVPSAFGVAGYVAPLALVTASYALFQAANNTAVMQDVPQDQRGVVSGLLNLSRNLGLFTGASAMGAVFALASGADVATAHPDAIAIGMRITFATGAGLVSVAFAIMVMGRLILRKM